jgi:cobalt/nickel transport system permease protein
MNHQLAPFTRSGTPLHRWKDARSKLIAFVTLIFVFSTVRDPVLLLCMWLFTCGLFALSGIPWSYLLRRLRLPGLLLTVMAVMLVFVADGTAWFGIGPLTVNKEGIIALAQIGSRFVCIVTLTVILFATTPVTAVMKGLQALKVPAVLVDMLSFSYRYAFEFSRLLKMMRTAAQLRGFRGKGWRTLPVWASLLGTMLIRSVEQAESVYQAMSLRGYGRTGLSLGPFRMEPADWLWLSAFLSIACLFALAQIFM